jgi:hypothetical protein
VGKVKPRQGFSNDYSCLFQKYQKKKKKGVWEAGEEMTFILFYLGAVRSMAVADLSV